MKSFNTKLENRIKLLALFALLAPLAIVVMVIISKEFSPERIVSFMVGFETVIIYRIIRYKKILKDKDAVEELEIAETDERNQTIQRKTSQTCLIFGIVLTSYGAIISSFINIVVFYTLAGVVLVFLLLYIVVLTYNNKRM